MSYQDHLKTCSYCSKSQQSQKPTVRVKSASSYNKQKKLSQLGAIIKGTSNPGISYPSIMKTKTTNVKAASASNANAERQFKLKELGKLIRS